MIVKATDTDFLILMCYAHSSQAHANKWIMNIDSERYVNFNTIQDHFGELVCNILPAYHSLIGCDTTSYAAKRGKVRPLNKLIKRKREELLETFGSLANPESNLEAAEELFKTMLYSGKKNESVTETTCRMYSEQKTKSSMNLIPDKSSLLEHLKRSNLQIYIWKQCTEQNITIPTRAGNGWKEQEGKIIPVSFLTSQLPSCLSRKLSRVEDGYNAGSEENIDRGKVDS